MAETNGRREQWHLDRADSQVKSNWDSGKKAKEKIEATIPPLVVAALASKRALLRSAEQMRLRKRYAAVSADVAELEKRLAEKRKELEAISLESIAVESETRQRIAIVPIPRLAESQLVTV